MAQYDLKTIMPINDTPWELIFYSALFTIGVYVFLKLFFYRPKQTESPNHLTRDRIRGLIKGTIQPRIYYEGTKITRDAKELSFSMLKMQYNMSKMFQAASESPENSLSIGQGMVIQPHSREHGIQSGQRAEALRLQIMSEYGIDLKTMEDVPEEYLQKVKSI